MNKAIVTTIILIVLMTFSACGGGTSTERSTLRDQDLIECEERVYREEALAGGLEEDLYAIAKEHCEATLSE